MSYLKICRICLRIDVELQELSDHLSDFLDELCDYATDNNALLCCAPCEYALRQCHSFKKHCLRANSILRNWKNKKAQERPLVHEIHQNLPLFKFTNPQKSDDLIENIETVESKNGSSSDDEQFDENMEQDDIKYDRHPNNSINDEYNHANSNDEVDDLDNEIQDQNELQMEDHYQNDDDDDDDSCHSELSVIKAEQCEIERTVQWQTDKREITDEPKRRRIRPRQPLAKRHEYETVFDIQIFETEAEVMREFEQRKNVERYVTAEYKCSICFTVYKFQKSLDFHMRWHDPSAGDFSCDICHMRFKRYRAVGKHKNNAHFGLFKCKLCPLVTYHKMVMMRHFEMHQGVVFNCKLCSGVYRHSSTYMTHLRTRHKTDHVCVTCARTFVSDHGLMAHRKIVHKTTTKFDSNATATCTDCNITFVTHAVYIVHVLTTPKHKDLAITIIGCPECGLQFDNKLQLRAHRRKHHTSYKPRVIKQRAKKNLQNGKNVGDRVLECTVCGKTGSHNAWLYRHYQAEHPEETYDKLYKKKRTHLCEECGRRFLTIPDLGEHKNIHTGAKPYSCEKCPAKFRRRINLKLHLERHLPPTRECQHCGKKFISAANLTSHLRSHAGVRCYKCTICDKAFVHSTALKEHVRGVHHHIRRTRKSLRCKQ